MIGGLRSRAVVTSLVRRLRGGIFAGDHSLLRQDGVDFCFRFRSVAGWSPSQRMQYSTSSNVISSPHPELTVLREDPPSVPHYVLNAFKKYSKQTALVDGVTGREVSYADLETMVAKVSSSLIRRGLVKKGSIVTMYCLNSIEFVVTYLAVTAAGAVVSPVNPANTVHELEKIVNQIQSPLLVASSEVIPVAAEARQRCPSIKELVVFGDGHQDCLAFNDLLADDMSHFPHNADINPREDLLGLPFSSGTTGLPKGVMLTHSSVYSNIEQLRSRYALNYREGEETFLGILPFFHIYGKVVIVLAGLVSGAKIVILPKFEPKLFLDTLQNHGVTYGFMVPPMMLMLAQHPLVSEYKFSSLSRIAVAAAPVSPLIIEKVHERLNNPNLLAKQGYGLTEASPATHVCSDDDIKYHTVGVAIQNTQFKVVDMETGEALGPGQSGELLVRGPQVMKGYYDNEKATKETLVDGWLHTGDVGYYDEDGHMIISDRIKEMIKVKGYQVTPAELESLLLSHSAVKDVAVVSKPDERRGELPTAFVVLKPDQSATQEDLQQFVAERAAPYKQLTGGVVFCSEIPKSAAGKILRRLLKDQLLK